MTTDPSGRYKGNNYDPNYRRPGSASQSRSQYGQGSGNGHGYSSATGGSTYAQDRGQNHGYGYSSQNQASPYARDNGYGRQSCSSDASAHPPGRNTSIPTGPASSYTAPLPARPVTPYESKPPPLPRHPPAEAPRGPAKDQEPVNPPRKTTYASMPDWGREDGEISSSGGPSSPSSARIHPSRFAQMPDSSLSSSQGNGNDPMSSLHNGQSPARAQTPVSVDPRQSASNQRNSKPAPLSFTTINAPPGVTTPTSSRQLQPNGSSSPAGKSPLDSLEKLRQFKEQVAASRKSVSNMSGPEMSKLAQVAETFLKSQNPEASADALQQLKQMASTAEETPSAPATDARQLSSGPSGPSGEPERPTSRQAELKERLLALKSGRDGTSQNPHEVSTAASSGQSEVSRPARPALVNGHGPGQKRDRDPDDLDRLDDDQKRFRAEAWQKAKDREREVQDAIDTFRESTQRQGHAAPQLPKPRPSGPSVPSPSHGEGHSPARPIRENGDDRRTFLTERIDTRAQHQQPVGRSPPGRHDAHSGPRDGSPGKAQYDYRTGRDEPAQGRSRSGSPGPRKPGPSAPRGYDRGNPADSQSGYRSDGSERGYRQDPRQRDRVVSERRAMPAPRTSHPPAPRRSIEAEYGRPRYEPVHRPTRDREPVSHHPSPVKSEQPLRTYEDRSRAVHEPVRYSREDAYARAVHPQPMPILVPALPAVDPATVHATLDILKAQIARLEQLVPATVPSPTQAYEYTYDRDPYRVAALPPPQKSYRLVEYEDRRREAPHTHQARRAISPSPPPPSLPPPRARGYEYEPRRPAPPPSSTGSPPTYHRREPAAPHSESVRAKEPYQRYQTPPKEDREYYSTNNNHNNHHYQRNSETKNHHRTQGYDNRSSSRGGRGGHQTYQHHSRGGSISTRGGSERGGRGGRGGGGARGGGHRY